MSKRMSKSDHECLVLTLLLVILRIKTENIPAVQAAEALAEALEGAWEMTPVPMEELVATVTRVVG